MPDKYEQALSVLGLAPGASEQAVRDAYRDLVKVWHPDRFGSDPRLRAKAQEKLKEINAAFEQLRDYQPGDFTAAHESAPRGTRAGNFSGPRPPEHTANHATRRRGSNATTLVLSVAFTAFVGTGFFLWHSSSPLFPAHERNQAAPAGSIRVPPKRQPPKSEPQPQDAAAEPAVQATTGSLLVASRPLGARVSFDGRVVGQTPLQVTEITPGEHRIEVMLDGHDYQPWSSSVVVSAGREEKLLAVMTPAER